MKLTVIIVNYNVKYFVEQCLDSLRKALVGIESEIYVVDNHSKDESVKYLRNRYRYVNVIDSNHNLGFSRANNIAVRQSTGEYVLFLNPDTFVGEDTLREAVAFLDANRQVGAVGVKMHNIDGSVAMESRRGVPSPMTSLYKMAGLCSRFPKSRRFGKYYMSYLPWDSPQKIEIISGAFFMARRSVLDKVGLLDEDFFMYGEDVDLSYRIMKGGYENWYLPQPIVHYKGESTKKSSFRYVHVFYNAMLIFFRKHYSHLGFFITAPIKLAIYFRASVALVQMLGDRARRSLGMADRTKTLPSFVFLGGDQMIERCRLIARRKGLTAEFIGCSEETLTDEEYVEAMGETKSPVYMVFDTDSFSYKKMIEVMNSHAQPNVKIGTFNNRTKTIITPSEIIK